MAHLRFVDPSLNIRGDRINLRATTNVTGVGDA
jgi:hypothetical protein